MVKNYGLQNHVKTKKIFEKFYQPIFKKLHGVSLEILFNCPFALTTMIRMRKNY